LKNNSRLRVAGESSIDVLLPMGCGMEADTPQSADKVRNKNTRDRIQDKQPALEE
jgi:hypothetical protein